MMKTAMMTAAVLAGTGCLSPLVSDTPTASSNLLPRNTTPPLASKNTDLSSQIATNDGLDDNALKATGIIPLASNGFIGGNPASYWAFGTMTRAPSPLYMLVKDDTDHTPLPHPPWVDALPGDPAYSAIHTLFEVVATDKYEDQVIATSDALADAIDLGLVKPPTPVLVPGSTSTPPAAYHLASPIVLDGTQIALDAAGKTATATPVYGHGVQAGIFLFGGVAGRQPGQFIQSTMQVSYLREQGVSASYDMNHPVFQTAPPADETQVQTKLTYTPLTTVVNVDLINGHPVADIKSDADLFTRDMGGNITGTTSVVASFQVTTNVILDEQQYASGAL
jgi:hypothetical protein